MLSHFQLIVIPERYGQTDSAGPMAWNALPDDLREPSLSADNFPKKDIKVLFTLDGNDKGLRGHSKKICNVRFNIDVRKYFFSNRVIDKWNNLDQDTVDAPSLNSFKNRLNKIRSTRIGFFMD